MITSDERITITVQNTHKKVTKQYISHDAEQYQCGPKEYHFMQLEELLKELRTYKMTDEEINKIISDYVEEKHNYYMLESFRTFDKRRQIVIEKIPALDPSKINYCNESSEHDMRRAEYVLIRSEKLSDAYSKKLLDIYNTGVKITIRHRAENFAKTVQEHGRK